MTRNLTVKRLIRIFRYLGYEATEDEVKNHLKSIGKKPRDLSRIEVLLMAADLWEASQQQKSAAKPQYSPNSSQSYQEAVNELLRMANDIGRKTA
jgi:hypothetical protein